MWHNGEKRLEEITDGIVNGGKNWREVVDGTSGKK